MNKSAHAVSGLVPTGTEALFLHKLRHDLINAVRPIVEIPVWMEEDIQAEKIDLPESLREHLDMLGTYGSRLNQMINDLLVYAHINQHPEKDAIPISTALDRLAYDILPEKFELITDLSHDSLPIPEPDMLNLLGVLLSNAVKLHDRSQGKIRVCCRKKRAGYN